MACLAGCFIFGLFRPGKGFQFLLYSGCHGRLPPWVSTILQDNSFPPLLFRLIAVYIGSFPFEEPVVKSRSRAPKLAEFGQVLDHGTVECFKLLECVASELEER